MTSLATRINKRLYLFRGVPGVGKSHLALLLADVLTDALEVATDDFWMLNEIPFDGKRLAEAHKWTQDKVEQWMGDRPPVENIIVHNTFTRKWEMDAYKQLAAKYGYEIIEVSLKSSLDAASLAERNQHQVPVETINKMLDRWED